MHLNTGRWTVHELDHIIRAAARIAGPGERVAFISEQFLGNAYQENTLIGDQQKDEEFVIDMSGLDCFTFLDYVEAMRLSGSFADFQKSLKQVRYKNGIVLFGTRNHFFTDWAEFRSAFVRDATKETGQGRVRELQKTLNRKDDGTFFLNGIEPVDRTIAYVPREEIDGTMLQRLKTGDYAGIYSDMPGLDVSHVGIIIRAGASLFLRHASSSSDLRKVVDQDLAQYVKGKPGLIILRPI